MRLDSDTDPPDPSDPPDAPNDEEPSVNGDTLESAITRESILEEIGESRCYGGWHVVIGNNNIDFLCYEEMQVKSYSYKLLLALLLVIKRISNFRGYAPTLSLNFTLF